MKQLSGLDVTLQDQLLLNKEQQNMDYLMELESDALLQNFTQEAGRYQNFGSKKLKHGGWEDPSCQLRGHFLGHWLSAAAIHYNETGNQALLGKANEIVHELRLCQLDNGGEWAASIPEKYFHWIAIKKQVWAPHYNVHKTFMGLIDMYLYAKNEEALTIAIDFSKWFLRYTDNRTREQLDDILDFETGGMLEIWAQLYDITKDSMYLTLIERYDRHRLFDPLLAGEDVLTNMHANTTIPEIIGCAAVYGATKITRYRDIVLAYWKCAVTDRGYFVTGGQTNGEIWTPKHRQASRLGERNQEHCSVYNMIRLANILFTWTGDVSYLNYIEKNLYNGILAQAYWKEDLPNGQISSYPSEGLLTYFLPMRAGSRKGWASKTQDFFCCHGSVVQANAAHNQYLYYQDGANLYAAQYFDSTARFSIGSTNVTLIQKQDSLSGSFHISSTSSAEQAIHENTQRYPIQPDCMAICMRIEMDSPCADFSLKLRIPDWACARTDSYAGNPAVFQDVCFELNGKQMSVDAKDGFLTIQRNWQNGDELRLILPLCITAVAADDDPDLVAFRFGPIALAGLCSEERSLHTHGHELQTLLLHDNEREWGNWKRTFHTRYQETGIRFIPIYDIGYEPYQVYFPVIRD